MTAATRSESAGRRTRPISCASVRPIWPKPSRTISIRSGWITEPPAIRESWKAACTRRCASAASAASTTTEMLSSEEPWAMATTLIPPAASAENTPAAMPGVPCMPRPTTAIVAMPGLTSTPSISPRAISPRNSRSSATRASSANGSGTLKQIECSDDAWEMSETEIRRP